MTLDPVILECYAQLSQTWLQNDSIIIFFQLEHNQKPPDIQIIQEEPKT